MKHIPNSLPRSLKTHLFFPNADEGYCHYLDIGVYHNSCTLSGKDISDCGCSAREHHITCPFLLNGNERSAEYRFQDRRKKLHSEELMFNKLKALANIGDKGNETN